MGLGLVYGGVRADGEVVSTEHDFYATHEALRLRFGRFRKIRLYDDPASATADAIVEAVKRGIGPRRRAARAHVGALRHRREAAAGREIGQALAARAPQRPAGRGRRRARPGRGRRADADRGVDVLVAGCHKWLGGPRGTGLVWSSNAWDRLQPTIPSFHPARTGPRRANFTPGGYHIVRAPLGARRGVRLPLQARPHARRRADPDARHAPEGGARRAPERPARHADGAGAVGGHRLLRRRRASTRTRRSSACCASTASPPPSRRTRSSTSGSAPACGWTRPTSTPPSTAISRL